MLDFKEFSSRLIQFSNHAQLTLEAKHQLFDVLKKSCKKLVDKIIFFLSDQNIEESLYDPEEYKKALAILRNPLKMYFYLIHWFVNLEEIYLKKLVSSNIKEKVCITL